MRVSRRLRAAGVALLVVTATWPPRTSGVRADAPDRGTLVVTMGDGTVVPLHNWSLSYEYSLYRQGTSPLAGTARRTESADLLVGKKAVPTPGQVLTFTYVDVPKALVAAGTVPATDRFKRPREIVVTGADGRKSTYRVDPPARELLVAAVDKGMAVTARTLDLRGETVTGTRKDLCLLSYTAAVECGGTPADAVVKVEFHR